MTVEVEQTDDLILDPRAIAKQFVTDAIVNLERARERDHEEWLADCAAMQRLERSASCKRGWANRKARLAGAVAPVDAPEDDE